MTFGCSRKLIVYSTFNSCRKRDHNQLSDITCSRASSSFYNQLSDGPKLNRRLRLVKCIPMIGVSFVQKVAISVSLVSVLTDGL